MSGSFSPFTSSEPLCPSCRGGCGWLLWPWALKELSVCSCPCGAQGCWGGGWSPVLVPKEPVSLSASPVASVCCWAAGRRAELCLNVGTSQWVCYPCARILVCVGGVMFSKHTP